MKISQLVAFCVAVKRVESLFWNKVDVRSSDECWEWGRYKMKSGYGVVTIAQYPYGAHRVAYCMTHGKIANGLLVMHSCDNPKCVNPSHLSAGTHDDNMRDMITKGRNMTNRPMGDAHSFAKLSSENVRSMRARHALGERISDLAREHGVDRGTAHHAISGKTWRCV